MIVTKSKHWKWLPGMRDASSGLICAGVCSAGAFWVDAKGDSTDCLEITDAFRPDLEDASTQGPIIFDIFEPLGIQFHTNGGDSVHWAVMNGDTFATAENRADLIRKAFAELKEGEQ